MSSTPHRTPPLVAAALLALGLAPAACRRADPDLHAGFVDDPQAQVAAQLAGRVDQILVREGEQVKKGQVLARLDARELQARLEQAQAVLAAAREGLRKAEADLLAARPSVAGAGAEIAGAQATLDEAEANYNRIRALHEGEAASSQDLDAARARLMEARAKLESLTAGRTGAERRVGAQLAAELGARAQVDVAQAAVHVAEVQLAQADIVAPFDGLVVNRDVEEGEWVAPGTPVITEEDPGRRWVRLDVGEGRLGGVAVDQPATVTLAALPGATFHGRVIEVGAEGDFAVNRDVKRGRPDLRTFRVRVLLADATGAVRPGMTAEVRLLPARAGEAPAGGAPVAAEGGR